jgi:cell division septum initiation protein DivIVA
MTTYYEYIFGFAADIYDLLEKGYSDYSKIEFLQLLYQARNQHQALQEENERLKEENERLRLEITSINVHFVSALERDVNHMRNALGKVMKPKYTYHRTVEQLDV